MVLRAQLDRPAGVQISTVPRSGISEADVFMKFVSKAVILAAVAAITLGAWAQQAPQEHAAPTANRARAARRNGMSKLNLTAQQKEQAKAIRQNAKQQVQSIRNNSALTAEQKKQQLQQVRQQTQQQLEGLLTPEQKAQLQQRHAARRSTRRNVAAIRNLNLTPQQKEQVKPIMQNARQQMQQVRQDASLNQEQKRERVAQIQQQTRSEMMNVLTPEQQQKLNNMRQRRQ